MPIRIEHGLIGQVTLCLVVASLRRRVVIDSTRCSGATSIIRRDRSDRRQVGDLATRRPSVVVELATSAADGLGAASA